MTYANELVNKFYQGKTIQKGYNFYVLFTANNILKDEKAFKGMNLDLNRFEVPSFETFPVQPKHVKSVVLPQPQTKFEMHRFGPFVQRHPMFDFESQLLKIDFTEDGVNTIQKFITWMTKRRMDYEGNYFPLSESACLDITVAVVNDLGETVVEYRFKKCSIANATELNYAYDSGEAMTVSIDFSYDFVDLVYNT